MKNGFTLAGATHVVIPKKIGHVGFTLAEVLITLGIIGVVAAMTMPTLIQNHRKKVVETKLRKFFTTINQVVKMAEVDNGPAKDWEWNTPQDMYDKYLKQYMQNVKEIKQDGSSSLYLYFTDGTYIVYAGTYMRFVTDNKERNDGTNSFVFMFDPKGKISKNYVEKGVFANYAYFTNITEESLYDECKTSGWYCSLLIQRNGWHIPKNYPRKL